MLRIALLILTCVALAKADEEEDSVLVLTAQNFDSTIRSNSFVLVEFYAPWCEHCKQFAPAYAAAAKALRSTKPAVPLAKVDATVETRLADQYGARGYPTLRFFVDGKDQEYTGGRTEQGVVTWVLRRVGPPAVKLEDAADAANFEAAHAFAAIALFSPGSGREAFELAAGQVEDVMFAYSESPEVVARYGIGAPALRMFFPHDALSADLTAELGDAEEIAAFVKAHRLPMVTKFDGEVASELFSDGRPLLFLIRDGDANGKAADVEIRKAAPAFRGRILVSVAGSSAMELMDYIGVDDEELPSVRLVANPGEAGMVKYKLEGELTEASITQFGLAFEAGGLRPHLKSEAEPTSQPGPVFTLVGSTLHQVVKDPMKDVMVEFYAPWCGHCKKLEPIYREVARKMKPVSTLVLARMDATANDAEGADVQGFPTIKFWAAGKKDEPLEYDGARDVESFVGWLQDRVTFPFSQEELKSEL